MLRLIKPTTACCARCGKLFEFEKPLETSNTAETYCSRECVGASMRAEYKRKRAKK